MGEDAIDTPVEETVASPVEEVVKAVPQTDEVPVEEVKEA